jgi:hypothetical protein
VRAARALERSRELPQERATGLVQTRARASIRLCHEDVPDDELADVATEAIEDIGKPQVTESIVAIDSNRPVKLVARDVGGYTVGHKC